MIASSCFGVQVGQVGVDEGIATTRIDLPRKDSQNRMPVLLDHAGVMALNSAVACGPARAGSTSAGPFLAPETCEQPLTH